MTEDKSKAYFKGFILIQWKTCDLNVPGSYLILNRF